jgi:phage gp29-like protein
MNPPANANAASRPILEEIASVPRRPWPSSGPLSAVRWGGSLDSRLGPVLRNEALRGGAASDIYAVYQEMEDKDGHLFASLQTRKLGVLARERRLMPPPAAEPFADEASRLCQRALDELPCFQQALAALLDCLAKGVAILEVVWRVAPDGAILPARLAPRWPGRFAFDDAGALRRVDADDPADGRAMPGRKFLVALLQPGSPGHPAAAGLCLRAYWHSWFKRNNLRWWALFNEKFGSPTVVAKVGEGADEAERQRLLEVVDSIQQDAGVVIPEGVAIELLEAKRSGSISTYRELADYCDDEISKVVLGQTLSTGEGRRSGSLALGRVHESIRDEYVEADARMLEDVVNGQLLRWIVDFNFGPGVAAPKLSIDTTREERMVEDAELDKLLLGLGVPLDLDYFYERYRRPRPVDPEEGKPSLALRFDDQNLFQYHLRFGVLTINEARARLGLGPVTWGNRPAGAAPSAEESRPPSAPPASGLAPGSSSSDDPAEVESTPEPSDDGRGER